MRKIRRSWDLGRWTEGLGGLGSGGWIEKKADRGRTQSQPEDRGARRVNRVKRAWQHAGRASTIYHSFVLDQKILLGAKFVEIL